MNDTQAEEIKAALAELISTINPEVRLVAKYGGVVMCPDPESDKRFVGGIFGYKDHVSLEFSQGTTLSDPQGQLEGKGKHRRHLKLSILEDIESKSAKTYLEQIL